MCGWVYCHKLYGQSKINNELSMSVICREEILCDWRRGTVWICLTYVFSAGKNQSVLFLFWTHDNSYNLYHISVVTIQILQCIINMLCYPAELFTVLYQLNCALCF